MRQKRYKKFIGQTALTNLRIINIVDEDSVYTDKSFDFTLELTPGTTTIKAGVSENNSGEFPSGYYSIVLLIRKITGRKRL